MRFFSIVLLVLALVGFFATAGMTAPATVQLDGRIVDAAGIPVAGAEVYLYRSKNVKKPAEFISTKTGEDGLYKAILPVGTYWSIAMSRQSGKKFGPLEEGDRHSGEPLVLEVREDLGQDYVILDLREAARKAQKRNADLFKISGRLVDAGGSPLAGAYALGDIGGKFKKLPGYISAWSDSSGEYSLYMPKGTYYLGGSLLYPPGSSFSLQQEITIGADIDGVDIVVESE